MIIGKDTIYNPAYEEEYGIPGIIIWDVIPLTEERATVIVRFLSTNSDDIQGARVAVQYGDGFVEKDGVKEKSVYLWEESNEEEYRLNVLSKEKRISFYNVIRRNGVMRSGLGYFGMIVKSEGNKRTYCCEHKKGDCAFDKAVIEVTIEY